MEQSVLIFGCCFLILLVVGLTFYRKKTKTEDDEINLLMSLGIDVFTTYIEEKGPEDVKQFDELSDYAIFVKNYLLDEISKSLMNKDEEVYHIINKAITNDLMDTIIDTVIQENFDVLEKTFESVKKK